MSATTELNPWQKLHSHIVSCNKGCVRNKKKVIHLCRIGSIYLSEALKEPDKKKKPMSFPFVAKLYERIGTPFGEARVVDRSIQERHMYQPENWKTGELGKWRTAQATIIGYEIETDDGARHYVRPHQIKSLRKREFAARHEGTVTPASGDLVILRRN